MNTLETIFTRKSVRQFKNQKVDEKDIKTILKAGMSGPTCVNSKDWSFIVVDDPELKEFFIKCIKQMVYQRNHYLNVILLF